MADTNVRKMKLREALALFHSLPVLDGHVESIVTEKKDGEKTTSTRVKPYKLGPDGKGGKVRWAIAKARSILGAENELFSKERDKIITDVSGGSGSIARTAPEDQPDPEYDTKLAEVNRRTAELLDAETTIAGLTNINLADLNLDDNPDLTATSLAPLMALISE